MSDFKYSKNVTKNHNIVKKYNCIESLKDLCNKESDKPINNPFTDEKCLNLDEFERNTTCKCDCTVDFAFGVKNKQDKLNAMVLVELKLNCTGGGSLKLTNLQNKITHSKSILGNNPIIASPTYFITDSSECKYKINRLFKNNPKKAKTIEIKDLYSMYFV